ncbi:MAG: hypothetical protein LLG13_11965 [Bacteroidales bacterium]|nr:hypothetical protein [Bacteroidales bacterium]
MRKLFLLSFILFLTIGVSDAQIFHKKSSRNTEKELFGKSAGKGKNVKIKEPGAVVKAKKKQEAKEKKHKKDYAKAVKESQKRAYDIQTPEVQARMKQNQKDSSIRDKAKKKNVKKNTKKARGKYR